MEGYGSLTPDLEGAISSPIHVRHPLEKSIEEEERDGSIKMEDGE